MDLIDRSTPQPSTSEQATSAPQAHVASPTRDVAVAPAQPRQEPPAPIANARLAALDLDDDADFSTEAYKAGGKALDFIEAPALSQRVRTLLGASPFRDARAQLDHQQQRDQLFSELRATTWVQGRLVDRLAYLYVDAGRCQRAIQTLIITSRAAAARELLAPNFSFYTRAPHSTLKTTGHVSTAYGEFMEDVGGRYTEMPDAEVTALAIAHLAKLGLPDDALDDLARVVAHDKIHGLEKTLASYSVEAERLVDQLMRLIDRRDRNRELKQRKDQ